MTYTVDTIHIAPMVVFLALAYSVQVAVPWMTPVLASLAIFMVVLPIVLCVASISRIILLKYASYRTTISTDTISDETTAKMAPHTARATFSLLTFLLSLPFGVTAAVLFLQSGTTHAALAIVITLIGVAAFFLLLFHLVNALIKYHIANTLNLPNVLDNDDAYDKTLPSGNLMQNAASGLAQAIILATPATLWENIKF
jgi:hypothetical protein